MAKKLYIDQNVIEAAIERIDECFHRFDKVYVSFSGGKDSTCCLHLALAAAERAGRLPLDLVFFDEEAIPPETVEFCEKVASDPRVRFHWLCVPIKHRNACSRHQPYWYCWNPEDKNKWCRPFPERGIADFPGFKRGMDATQSSAVLFGPENGSVCNIVGMRSDESLRRYRIVTARVEDNWVSCNYGGYWHQAKPIYDWTATDVWLAHKKFGWDHNRAYDIMAKAGIAPQNQRCCPPYGEEPLSRLWTYAVCWPELWDKMIARVDGAATAGRYARTELYGFGKMSLPDGLTWREWAFRLIDLYPEEWRGNVAASLMRAINWHKRQTTRPIHDSEPDPVTGISWKLLAQLANRGDLKGRRAGKIIESGVGGMSAEERERIIREYKDDEQQTRY